MSQGTSDTFGTSGSAGGSGQESEGPPDADAFRRAMGRFATGVSMLTTRTREVDYAMTASAITSVSLEPLLLLICIDREGRFHDAVVDAGCWGISLISGRDRAVADWLATPGRPVHGQLDRVAHHHGSQTGVALLNDALSTFECRTTDVYVAGDHSIVVGEVVSLTSSPHSGEALVYYRGRYGTLE
ncbi:MAG: flavin reductase [Actinomycetota bacterium]|jgi:flavin reductase (DIM6/NTAB) family NADH-FMN oxidoreductase RutF|nr:flavin reductase [Actinomycetota bacterium]